MQTKPSTPAPTPEALLPGATLRWTPRGMECRDSMETVALTLPVLLPLPQSVSPLEAPLPELPASSPLCMQAPPTPVAPLMGETLPGATHKWTLRAKERLVGMATVGPVLLALGQQLLQPQHRLLQQLMLVWLLVLQLVPHQQQHQQPLPQLQQLQLPLPQQPQLQQPGHTHQEFFDY